MEKKSAEHFQFRLKSIKEIEFFFDQDTEKLNSMEGNQPDLQFGQAFISNGAYHFTYLFGVVFSFEKQRVLESRLAFEFETRGGDVIFDGEIFKIPDSFMRAILNICIGALRGVLVVKTAGTKLADYPLPLLDPTHLLQIFSKQTDKATSKKPTKK